MINIFHTKGAVSILFIILLIASGCKSKQRAYSMSGGKGVARSSAGKKSRVATKAMGYYSPIMGNSSRTKRASTSNPNLSNSSNSKEGDEDSEFIPFEAGKLTATEINDFQKWDLWQDITADELSGYQEIWKIFPQIRYMVQLTNEEIQPLVDIEVELRSGKAQTLWKTKTDNQGRAELWFSPFEDNPQTDQEAQLIVHYKGREIIEHSPVIAKDGVNFITVEGDCTPPNALDIAFVVDATGSMDDEIGFLKTDLMDVLEKTQIRHPDLALRFGSLFYKCPGNDYITRKFDFSSQLKNGIKFIKQQDAEGGGDESVEVALHEAVHDLNWSDQARARLLFLVLDESPGTRDSIVSNMHAAIKDAAAEGIHIIPIVASGLDYDKDRYLEYLMRSIALATNGTNAFLTDDSGIGNDHTEPVTDEMVVEILGDLMGRLIDQYVEVVPCNAAPLEMRETIDTTSVKVEPLLVLDEKELKRIEIDSAYMDGKLIYPRTDSIAPLASESNLEKQGIVNPSGFRFFPNPTMGPLTVEFQGDVQEIFITDAAGKIIQRLAGGKNGSIQTNLSRFPAGNYYIRYIEKGRVRGARLVLFH